jgi:carbon storage regulator
MLVLGRRLGEGILIGEEVEVVVVGVRGDQVRLGIRAPRRVAVRRRELLEQVSAENRAAARAAMVMPPGRASECETGRGPRALKPRRDLADILE